LNKEERDNLLALRAAAQATIDMIDYSLQCKHEDVLQVAPLGDTSPYYICRTCGAMVTQMEDA
jgi:hypothetical protein